MTLHGTALTAVDGPTAVGRLAVVLARSGGQDVGAALEVLVTSLALHSAVLRRVTPTGGAGELIAVAGAVVQAVPVRRASGPRTAGTGLAVVELPVRGQGNRHLATLIVVDAGPSLLPALRTAAAVLALAVVRADATQPLVALAEDLLAGADADAHALADALHDGAVQDLVAARWALDAGDSDVARAAVQRALVALRRTIWQFRPRGGQHLHDDLSALARRQAEAGRVPVLVHPPAGDEHLAGAAAVTAYRLVQAVTGTAPATASLAAGGGSVVLSVEGAADLPDPARWRRRARALGGDLFCSAGRLRLSLPAVPRPAPYRPHACADDLENEVHP